MATLIFGPIIPTANLADIDAKATERRKRIAEVERQTRTRHRRQLNNDIAVARAAEADPPTNSEFTSFMDEEFFRNMRTVRRTWVSKLGVSGLMVVMGGTLGNVPLAAQGVVSAGALLRGTPRMVRYQWNRILIGRKVNERWRRLIEIHGRLTPSESVSIRTRATQFLKGPRVRGLRMPTADELDDANVRDAETIRLGKEIVADIERLDDLEENHSITPAATRWGRAEKFAGIVAFGFGVAAMSWSPISWEHAGLAFGAATASVGTSQIYFRSLRKIGKEVHTRKSNIEFERSQQRAITHVLERTHQEVGRMNFPGTTEPRVEFPTKAASEGARSMRALRTAHNEYIDSLITAGEIAIGPGRDGPLMAPITSIILGRPPTPDDPDYQEYFDHADRRDDLGFAFWTIALTAVGELDRMRDAAAPAVDIDNFRDNEVLPALQVLHDQALYAHRPPAGRTARPTAREVIAFPDLEF